MSKAIPEGWKRQKLIEVAQPISYGVKPFEGYRTYIATADLNGHGIIGGVPVTYENRASRADLALENGNVIFARMKETVKVLEVLNGTEKYIFSTGFAGLKPQTDLVSGFLKQFFLSKEFNRLKDSLCTGSTQMAITSDGIEQIDILLPPLPEQHKIAAILGSVDKAIEKTRAVIEQTRSLKRAMMQELLTRGIPGRHKKFKKTPIGEIPEEWAVVRFGECGRFRSGGTPSKKSEAYWEGPVPWVSPKDMKVSRIYDAQDHISEEALKHGSQLALPGNILIVVRGMILAHTFPVAIVDRAVAFNQDIKAFECNERVLPEFMLQELIHNSTSLLDIVSESTHGTKKIPQEELESFLFPLPDKEEQALISDLFKKVDNRLSADAAILDGFGRMKDALMQNLLSGKIRVKKED